MKLTTIKSKIDTFGLKTNISQLTGGGESLFISLETNINGTARTIDRATESELMKYLKRYKIPFKYGGNYTNIIITN